MQENKTVERVKIAVVGPGAVGLIEVLAPRYPSAELIPMDRAPTDMPYVFADSEQQQRKTEADRRRAIHVVTDDVRKPLDCGPDERRFIKEPEPTESYRPMNRRERRRLAALNRGAAQR